MKNIFKQENLIIVMLLVITIIQLVNLNYVNVKRSSMDYCMDFAFDAMAGVANYGTEEQMYQEFERTYKRCGRGAGLEI